MLRVLNLKAKGYSDASNPLRDELWADFGYNGAKCG